MLGLTLGLIALPVLAGQNGAGFTAGIVIGKPDNAHKPPRHYTWGAAAVSLRRAGYKNIERDQAAEGLYWFVARKDAAFFRIAVSADTGTIVAVTPA
jgi:hypothetical protein